MKDYLSIIINVADYKIQLGELSNATIDLKILKF